MNIGKYEIGILIPQLLFVIILLLYTLFVYLKEINKIKIEIKQGNFYYFLLILNFILLIIIILLSFFISYLNVYSIFVVAKIPNDFKTINDYLAFKDEWEKNKIVPVVHIISNFLNVCFISLLISPLYNNIKSYLNMNFEENQKIKTGSLSINDLFFSIKMKSDYLYLLQSEENNENFYQIANLEKPYPINESEVTALNKIVKCLAFKKIFINDFTNEYVYMILEYPSIIDQLPLANPGFEKLFFFCLSSFFALLFLSIPSSKIHIKNEIDYIKSIEEINAKEKKPKFFGIYKIYGNFEETTTIIRIIYFILEICSLFILMIRRLIYGGFKKINLIKGVIIFYILLLIINFIDIILSVLIILFSIFCNLIDLNEKTTEHNFQEYDNSTEEKTTELTETSIITIKLVFQIVVNCLTLFIGDLTLFIFTIKNLLYHFDIIKSCKRVNENIIFNDLNQEIVFEYRSLNNNRKRLAEYRIEGFPKFLFFKYESNSQIRIIEKN